MKEQTLSDEQILSRFISSAEKLQALVQGLSRADLFSSALTIEIAFMVVALWGPKRLTRLP